MEKRPKIELPLSTIDVLVDILCFVVVGLTWAYTLMNYGKLPDGIPIHFDISGNPNGFGSKIFLFILPIVATGMVIGLSILGRYPHTFNFPNEITEENALRQYTLGTALIRTIKFEMALFLGFLCYQIVRSAIEQKNELPIWILLLLMFPIILTVIFFIGKMSKVK